MREMVSIFNDELKGSPVTERHHKYCMSRPDLFTVGPGMKQELGV